VNQALALKPKNPQYWRGKGLTLISIGQYRGALIAFDKVLQIEPNNPEVWCYKGETLHRLGYFHEALAAFDEALRRHPEFPEAWYNKGLTLFDLHINGRVRVNEQAMIWLCRAWKTRQSLPTGAAAVLHDKICKLGHRLEECEEILSRQS
jgi:tetratricopeptide (TPR) repeat protein